MSENKGILAKLSPKSSFFAGIGITLFIFFIVGFFVLLGIVLKGDDNGNNLAAVNNAPDNNQVNQGQGGVAGEQVDINVTPVSEDDWVRGSRDAQISFIEYSDLECPFCQQFHPELKKLIEAYPNDVNWVYRHFPLASLHPKAPKEAEATECAGELGGNDKFWEYIDKIYEVTPSNNGLDLAQLPILAGEVGLDVNKFQECLDSGRHADKVSQHYSDAVSAGGQGTPYSVVLIDGEEFPVSGYVPFEQLKSMVDSVIQ